MGNPIPFNQAVIDEFRTNGGRVSRLPNGNPLLLLTTTGAKSGLPRTSPVGYSTEGDRLIIAATGMTGEGSYPQWYYNLLAHPIVTIERGTERFQARGTVVTGQERERLFEQHATLMPIFREYVRRTSRIPPMILLERLG